ncbi:MAG TPA: hypothetical protein VGE93_12905 [Bryobacteraceae bacterium]
MPFDLAIVDLLDYTDWERGKWLDCSGNVVDRLWRSARDRTGTVDFKGSASW